MKTPLMFTLLALMATPVWAEAPAAAAAPAGWAQSRSPSTDMPAAPSARPVAQGTGVAPPPPIGATLSGSDPLPPPSPLYAQAEEAVSPLTPEEIRQLRARQSDISRAMTSPAVAVVPRISALTVDLSPGASLPLVRTAVNYPSSLTFMDSTGAPWKIGAAPLSGNPDFIVYWVPDSPVMVVYAQRPFVSGNITVYLDGLSVPILLNVTSGEPDTAANTWTVDSRLDMRIPRRGPAAKATALPESRIGLHDSTLQSFLDGVPPKEARRLNVTGGVPDTTVWQLGDDLYIRSRAYIRDEFEATLSSADGTRLWKLPVTPYVSFSVMGKTTALNIALE